MRGLLDRLPEAARDGVSFDVTRELDHDTGLGIVDREIDRQQRTERVVVLLRYIHTTLPRMIDQRGQDFNRPDLRRFRTRGRLGTMQFDLPGGAADQTTRTRGIDSHT